MVYKDINSYPDEWIGATANDTERGHLILRINSGIKEAVGHPEYPIRMGIAIPLNPELVKDPILYSLEDAIEETLKEDTQGILTVSITGMNEPMFRELLYYTKDSIDFATLHKELKDKFPQLEIQMYAEMDPAWDGYKGFMVD